jgi:hypothetical protein
VVGAGAVSVGSTWSVSPGAGDAGLAGRLQAPSRALMIKIPMIIILFLFVLFIFITCVFLVVNETEFNRLMSGLP